MNPETLLSVQNLAKAYRLNHQVDRPRYVSLRDVISERVRAVFSPGQKPANSASAEDFWALQDVDFEVQRGDALGIIGRNGAGKSTLLKILSRITEPTRGRIRIKGRVASLLEVGTGFHPELTGRENIYLNGSILGMKRAEIRKKFDEIVDFAEIEKFLDTPVKRYSSGMYVRLAFAVAAHLEPEILILDEVLAVGDSQFQKKCLGKMDSVAKMEGRTILFVSHQMGAISTLCEKALLLEKGRVILQGKTREVIQAYLSRGETSEGYRIDAKKRISGANLILTADLLDKKSQMRNRFAFSEQITLSATVQLPQKTNDFFFVVGLDNHHQARVFTIFKEILEFREEGSPFTFTLRLPADLISPGNYSFTLALFHHGVGVQDIQSNICSVSIYDDGSPLFRWEGVDHGSVIIKPEWIDLG